tara:strand:+ start:211 stop:471 length:261 start_codon:yes stop_codon:yes gene_type:complete
MKKIIFIILTSILLTNCGKYTPLVNPETSKDKHTGKVIAGNYWKDLHACRYIHKENTAKIVKALKISDETVFVKNCMKEYGYTILR